MTHRALPGPQVHQALLALPAACLLSAVVMFWQSVKKTVPSAALSRSLAYVMGMPPAGSRGKAGLTRLDRDTRRPLGPPSSITRP